MFALMRTVKLKLLIAIICKDDFLHLHFNVDATKAAFHANNKILLSASIVLETECRVQVIEIISSHCTVIYNKHILT